MEPTGDLLSLQPTIFAAMQYMMCVDDQARKGVAEGGFGFRGGMTTLEGLCELIRDWNQLHRTEAKGEELCEKVIPVPTSVVAAKAA